MKIKNNILYIGDKKIEFKNAIVKAERTEDRIIVLTKNPELENDIDQPVNNIICVSPDGKKVCDILKLTNCYTFYPDFEIITHDNQNFLVTRDLFGIQYTSDIKELALIKREGTNPIQFEADWNSIRIGDKKIGFKDSITKLAQINNSIIIHLLDMSTGDVTKQPDDNIIAIDGDGNILWNIKDITRKQKNLYSSFDLKKIENKIMMVTRDCFGVYFTIDLDNLTVVRKEGYTFF